MLHAAGRGARRAAGRTAPPRPAPPGHLLRTSRPRHALVVVGPRAGHVAGSRHKSTNQRLVGVPRAVTHRHRCCDSDRRHDDAVVEDSHHAVRWLQILEWEAALSPADMVTELVAREGLPTGCAHCLECGWRDAAAEGGDDGEGAYLPGRGCPWREPPAASRRRPRGIRDLSARARRRRAGPVREPQPPPEHRQGTARPERDRSADRTGRRLAAH